MDGKNTLKTSLTTALVLVGLSTLLAFYCLNKYIADSKQVDKLNAEVAMLEDIKYASRDAVARVRGYILVEEAGFMKNYENSFTEVSNNFTKLQASFDGDAQKQQKLQEIKTRVMSRYHNLELLLVAHKLKDSKSVRTLIIQSLGSSNAINEMMNQMEKGNNAALLKIRASQGFFRTVVILISLLTYVLSFTLLYLSLKAYKRADKEKEAAYSALESKNKELFKLNNSLDEKVKQRTAELENKNNELNLYAEQLKNSFDDLEVKVKFRTLELEKNIRQLEAENKILKADNKL